MAPVADTVEGMTNIERKATYERTYPGVKIHESAYIDPPATIGEGTQIWHFSHLLKNCTIGNNCRIGQNVVLGPEITVGNNVKIQNNVSVYTGVTLEDDVFCGPSMVFTNVTTPRCAVPRNTADAFAPTLVKRGASIGANVTIVCGVTIGQYALIGAGAVVTKNVPDYALMVGNPARQKGWACYCGEPLPKQEATELVCSECERHYMVYGGQLKAI